MSRTRGECMSEDSIRGEVVTMDDSEMRKSDHKRLMRLERRVDHSIVLLETLTRQMADMMLSFKTGNKQTRGRIRTGSHGSYHSSFKRGLTTTESAVLIQKSWRGYSQRVFTQLSSRSSTMSGGSTNEDELLPPSTPPASAPRKLSNSSLSMRAWSGVNDNEPKINREIADRKRQSEMELVQLAQQSNNPSPSTSLFPSVQQAVQTHTSSFVGSKLPFVSNIFSKKQSEREVITNSDGSYEVIEHQRDVSYVIQEEAEWMINPKGRFRLSWDFILVTPMLLYLAVMMPFRLCFANEPKTFSPIYWFEFMIDIIFLIDICFNFRTGYFVNPLEPTLIEYDATRVRYNYGTTWFPLDLASGIPFGLIELIFATGPTSGVKTLKTVRLIRFIKLGRLFKIEKILTNIDRDTMDRIEDFFQNNNTRSALVIFGLALKTGFVCHLLSCLWVFIGRQGSMNDVDNWLDRDMKGPFTYRDTYQGSEYVGQIYLGAFYFCFTTMSSVGYGDVVPSNSMERIFTIFLEFTGSLVFATIIAALTSVVTSMDTNQRKIAEQLDSVASFVVNRNFPDALGRRIRRHFRHFYSLKSAIDESKIFGELSTSLRKEVSAYLVSELMGDVSLFTTMSPLLWPHLLPILRPMRFEAEEIVCRQEEQCREMYVILSGKLTGTTDVVGDESKIRRISSGDTINVLCVLGIWSKCVETVIVADVAVETYAVSEKDFSGLFLSEADIQTFEEMKFKEVHNFKMDTTIKCQADAVNEFGKPLYLCIFSLLDLTIINARDLAPTGFDGLSDTYTVVDIIHGRNGQVISKAFSYKTNTINNTNDPCWMESFKWMDIPCSFDKLVLRISVYDSDFVGLDTFLGMVQIPFPQLLKQCTQALSNKNNYYQNYNTYPSSSNNNNNNNNNKYPIGGIKVLETVPSLNLKDDEDSLTRSGRKSYDYDIHPEPDFPPPHHLPPIQSDINDKQENQEGDKDDKNKQNNSNNARFKKIQGLGHLVKSNSVNSEVSTSRSSSSSLTSPLNFIRHSQDHSKNKKKKSHESQDPTNLPKLQYGHVQQWYDLKPKDKDIIKDKRKSWNGKIYPADQISKNDLNGSSNNNRNSISSGGAPTRSRHAHVLGKKPTLEVATVTGAIQIRYFVKKAEREVVETFPSILPHSVPVGRSPMKKKSSFSLGI